MNSLQTQSVMPISTHRFKQVMMRDITIPRSYEHENRISLFLERNRLSEGFCRAEVDFSDHNFQKVSEKLIPSQRYRVRILQIIIPVTLDEALEFLRRRHSSLVGAQGLTVLWEVARNDLPIVRRILSLDERTNLPLSGGRHMMPYLFRGSGGASSFHLDPSNLRIDEKYCLAAFEGLP